MRRVGHSCGILHLIPPWQGFQAVLLVAAGRFALLLCGLVLYIRVCSWSMQCTEAELCGLLCGLLCLTAHLGFSGDAAM